MSLFPTIEHYIDAGVHLSSKKAVKTGNFSV